MEYKLCKRGHIRNLENVTKSGRCKLCAKIYREENKIKIKKYRRKYYVDHREEKLEWKKKWRKNNHTRAREIEKKSDAKSKRKGVGAYSKEKMAIKTERWANKLAREIYGEEAYNEEI